MKKAGGILAIVSGVWALVLALAAGLYIFAAYGNTPAAHGIPKSDLGSFVIGATVAVLLLVVSVTVIVLGAVAIRTQSRRPSVVLIVCAFPEAVLVGLLLFWAANRLSSPAPAMLTLVGGVLALAGTPKPADTSPAAEPSSK